MRRPIVLLATFAACGGASKSQPAPDSPDDGWSAPKVKPDRAIEQWTVDDENKFIDVACRNVVVDGNFRCVAIEDFGLAPTSCAESFQKLRATISDDQRVAFRLVVSGLSVATSCSDVDATFRLAARLAGAEPPKPTETPGECTGDPFAPHKLSSEDVLRRRGLGDRVFGETPSSVNAPIEVCSVRGEQEYLLRLTCADGSRPWGRDVDKVRAARVGSRRAMNKCGVAMIDHYVAPCPDKQHDVFLNMYMCGPGEDVFDGKRP